MSIIYHASDQESATRQVVAPIRYSSTARAAWRPSRIAQTTSDWPRRMSPAAKTFGSRPVVDGVALTLPRWSSSSAEVLDHAVVHRAREAHGEEHEIGLELELRAGDRLELVVDADAVKSLHAAVRAGELLGQHREVALGALLLAGRGAQLQRPVRPGQRLVLLVRRLRHDLELGDRARPGGTAVPMQSEPVSPPPMTTTCLPSARIGSTSSERLAADAAVLLRQELHREVDAVAGRGRGSAGRAAFRRRRQSTTASWRSRSSLVGRSMPTWTLQWKVTPSASICGDAALDDVLLHLEVGDAVAEQAAGVGVLLVKVHVVAGARELLGAGDAGRARADHGDALAGLRPAARA